MLPLHHDPKLSDGSIDLKRRTRDISVSLLIRPPTGSLCRQRAVSGSAKRAGRRSNPRLRCFRPPLDRLSYRPQGTCQTFDRECRRSHANECFGDTKKARRLATPGLLEVGRQAVGHKRSGSVPSAFQTRNELRGSGQFSRRLSVTASRRPPLCKRRLRQRAVDMGVLISPGRSPLVVRGRVRRSNR